MKKDDLRSGMVVKTREGQAYSVILNVYTTHCDSPLKKDDIIDRLIGLDGHLDLDRFDNDLTHIKFKEFDIVEVRATSYISRMEHLTPAFNKSDLRVLWERQEAKELTMEEISKALGYKVKIVKEEL